MQVMRPLDKVILEVAYANGHEWYGWPGDNTFTHDDPADLINSGMIGDGLFAMALNDIFLSNQTVFTPGGEEDVGGRKVVKFDYSLSRRAAALHLILIDGSDTVGEAGTIWVDPQSLDLLRLESHAQEVPITLHLDELNMRVTFARTQIGGSNALLPQQGDVHLSASKRRYDTFDHFEFTHCRQFQAQSTIRFDVAPSEPASASPPAEPAPRIPALLKVTVKLTSPIASSHPVGSLIEGRIEGDVTNRGRLVLRNGAAVRGRIRRLERFKGSNNFIVGLEFTEVEAYNQGQAVRFYADMLSMEKRAGVERGLTEQILVPGKVVLETVKLPELPGVAQFFVTGPKLNLAGLRTVWRTRGEIHGLKYQ